MMLTYTWEWWIDYFILLITEFKKSPKVYWFLYFTFLISIIINYHNHDLNQINFIISYQTIDLFFNYVIIVLFINKNLY